MAMLPRAARPVLTSAAPLLRASQSAGFHSSGAQMATLRELEQRVKSVKNIEKITKVSGRAVDRGDSGGCSGSTEDCH